MTYSQPAPRARRRARATILATVVVAAFTGVVGCRSLAGSSSLAAGSAAAGAALHASHERLHGGVPGEPPEPGPGDQHQSLGAGDGKVPDGVTVFDDEYPAVANLDPALLGALRRAARDAGAEGVALHVSSGWRSPAYQEQLLEAAVSEYGSRAEAARWVATPATSPHVSGDAVDLGRSDATSWLSEHGAGYGLCQIYKNEPWHYELRAEDVGQGCPLMFADPTHDPRMQQ